VITPSTYERPTAMFGISFNCPYLMLKNLSWATLGAVASASYLFVYIKQLAQEEYDSKLFQQKFIEKLGPLNQQPIFLGVIKKDAKELVEEGEAEEPEFKCDCDDCKKEADKQIQTEIEERYKDTEENGQLEQEIRARLPKEQAEKYLLEITKEAKRHQHADEEGVVEATIDFIQSQSARNGKQAEEDGQKASRARGG
jgi:hypothetical protein